MLRSRYAIEHCSSMMRSSTKQNPSPQPPRAREIERAIVGFAAAIALYAIGDALFEPLVLASYGAFIFAAINLGIWVARSLRRRSR